MKKNFSLLLIIFCISSIFLNLRANADTPNSFNVGVVIPLSGDLADYGTAIRHGIKLAAIEAPEKFSNVKFIYEDSKYDGKTAVTALQKLRAANSVNLYYLWGVSPTEAILPIADAAHLPVIAETTIKEATTNRKSVIRAARTGERIAKALTAQLVERGFKKVSFITAEIPFYTDIVKHLEILLPQNGISISRNDRVSPEFNDLRSYLPRISSDKVDGLGVFLLPAQLIAFYQQAKELNISVKTFSADIIGSQSIIDQCPETINGTFYSTVGLSEWFPGKYRTRFNDDTHLGQAAQGYDFAMLVGELFNKTKVKLSSTEVMKVLEAIEPHDGAAGRFKYSDTPDGGKEFQMPVAINEIREKKIFTVLANAG